MSCIGCTISSIDDLTKHNRCQTQTAKAEAFKQRCRALESKLKKSQRKRKSPDSSLDEPPKDEAKPPPAKMKKPFKDIVAVTAEPENPSTDDEVPVPDEQEQAKKKPLYTGLNSVLCAYKAGDIEPSTTGNITFEMVAELCEEDAAHAAKWSKADIQARHPMIISALRLVYKDKKDDWFKKPFLVSAKGAHKYWIQVLERRAQIWRAKMRKKKASSDLSSVTARLRAKIKVRENRHCKNLIRKSLSPGHASTPIVLDSDSSGSDSSASDDQPVVTAKDSLAPGPESYSSMEIKRFAKIAKQIREVDESVGHSNAIAAFIDEEFSDNSSAMVKARRQPAGSWKRERFNAACMRAAKIMEDRYPFIHL